MRFKRLFLAAAAGVGVFLLPPAARSGQIPPGHVPEAVARLHLQPVGRLAGTNRLNLAIGLPLRNREALTNLLRQLYDPRSPQYHKFVTPSQFTARFGPTEQDYQAVVAFARRSGLAVTGTHPSRDLLDVRGAVADVEKAFHVKMNLYPHPTERRMFYAPDTEPSVTPEVPILSVGGLNNYALPRPMNLQASASTRPMGAQPQNGSGPEGYYLGNDFRAAYVPGVALTGAGQTVGLVEFDSGYYTNDIAAYESLADLPTVPVTAVLIDGYDGGPGDGNVEVSLDIEMAIAMAPGLDQVLVYEGSAPDDILLQMAEDDAAQQISASWGYPTDATTEQYYQRFAAQGQSFFNASGDGDAWLGPIPYGSCEDPNITIVGGTTLTMSGNGAAYASESVWNWGFVGDWNWNPDGYVGSSGGISTDVSIPSWQQGVNMSANHGSIAMRNVPDVALTADGIWVIAGNGQAAPGAGTSCAAPLWAGFMALVNQQAAAYGQPPAGFLNPAIYGLGQGPLYAACFHDVTTGSNTWDQTPTNFFAVPGYDLCTGWGTPNGAALINALAPADWLVVAPLYGFTFSGNAGGPFAITSQSFAVTNSGTDSLAWSLSNNSPWLQVSTTGGTLLPGAPSTTVVASLGPAADSLPPGAYTATIWFTNLNDFVGQGRTFTLNVLGAPFIAAQPQNQQADAGYSAAFTVVAAGASPLNYCWQRNGISLTGATNATYSISNVQAADSGSLFDCIVTNVFGAVTSSVVSLTVFTTTLYSFSGPDGSAPFAGLMQGADGNLYGTTYSGGTYNSGTVFKLTTNGTLTTLDSFGNSTNGANPFATLVQGSDGCLYGTTEYGGIYDYGTVFKLTTNGALTTLAGFSEATGDNPLGALVQAADGNFYGTTENGGTDSEGNVFRMTVNGELANLANLLWFNVTDGEQPGGGLVQGSDGNLYGTTLGGGAYTNYGTVFKLTTNGALTTLVSFDNSDGADPWANLVQGTDGCFYGTTVNGGDYDYGNVFMVTTNGLLTTLASFNGTNGWYPQGALVQASDGNFYGTTFYGGADHLGTVFKMAPGGLLTTILTFEGPNGAHPHGTLIEATDGYLYGTTISGSIGYNATNSGNGVIFRLAVPAPPHITAQPQNQLAYAGGTATFTISVSGAKPPNYFWQENGGAIPGATNATYTTGTLQLSDSGSQFSCVITNVFGAVTSSVASLTVVSPPWHLFGGSDGANPADALVQGNDGNFYGTTESGGTNSSGTVFQLTTNGILTTLVSFNGTDGSLPQAGLVQGSDGNFYGAAEEGGYDFVGTLFRVTTNGALVVLDYFNNGNGAGPSASLVQGSDGNLYGTTVAGGNLMINFGGGGGTLFRVTTNGALTTLVPFAMTNGMFPEASLTLGSDGNFYGTTGVGFNNNSGTVFRVTTNGALTTLVSFNGTNGSGPEAALVQGGEGDFYGTTLAGGAANLGTVFRMTTNGLLTTLVSFNGTNGSYPQAALEPASDGYFYGTASSGGASGDGTVFRMSPDGLLTTILTFTGINGAKPEGALIQGADGCLYGTTCYGGIGYNGSAYSGEGTIYRLVVASPPDIILQPFCQTVQSGTAVSFAASAIGAQPLNFQWQFNGNNIPGATNAGYTMAGVAAAAAGGYDVIITNDYGSITSAVAVLTVLLPPGVITSGGQPVVFFPTAETNYSLQMATDPASDNWTTVANGAPWSGLGITNGPEAAFFRLAAAELTGLAAGYNFSLFLKSDGSLWAMGANASGQLGDGTTNGTNQPEQIVSSNVTAMAAGYQFSLFLKGDGSLWAMGANDSGQLGDGTTNGTNQPEQIVSSNVTAIAAGYLHSLFLKSDGSLWGMGANDRGQLGNFTESYLTQPWQIVAGNVTAIAAGYQFSLFLKSDGSLWAMGDNDNGQLGDGTYLANWAEQIVSSNVTAIAAGYAHSLFLKSDGSLWAMGWDNVGQLGDGTYGAAPNPYSGTNLPEQIVAGNVTAIAAGGSHSLLLKEDGSLWAMGDNLFGQLGDGTYNNTNQPEQIVAGNVTAIAGGGWHSLLLKSDGSLWGMGWNQYGQLGDGTYNDTNQPEQIGALPAPALAGLGVGIYGGQPVILFPTINQNLNSWLLMTTNLASSLWAPATNGIPFTGLQLTNAPSPVYFRLF